MIDNLVREILNFAGKFVRKYDKIEKYWHELIVSLDLVTIAAISSLVNTQSKCSQYPGVFVISEHLIWYSEGW